MTAALSPQQKVRAGVSEHKYENRSNEATAEWQT